MVAWEAAWSRRSRGAKLASGDGGRAAPGAATMRRESFGPRKRVPDAQRLIGLEERRCSNLMIYWRLFPRRVATVRAHPSHPRRRRPLATVGLETMYLPN